MKLLYTLILILLSCSTEPEDVHGCLDNQACNYSPSATIDNNSCEYMDDCDVCDADTTNDNSTCEQDCESIWGGLAQEDECGECGGDNSTCADCAGVPNGSAYVDNCGACDDDVSNDCVQDCAGIWGGDTAIYECSADGCNYPFVSWDMENSIEIECDLESIDFNNQFNEGDIQFLQELISSNNLTEESSQIDFNNGNGVLEPLEIGQQVWIDGRLEWLNLWGNITETSPWSFEYFNYNISNIPESISSLDEIKYLDFDHNNINELPETFSQLEGLETLWISDNGLHEIPFQIWNLTNLKNLGFSIINLPKDEIPEGISGLNNLISLFIGSSQFTGEIPAWIGNLTDLTILQIYNNELTGEIPSEIGQLTNLRNLQLSINQLTGEIPPEIGELTNLSSLVLSNNQISGGIPSWLGNLTSLTNINLRNNQLTGEIPSEIGQLTNLTQLWLRNNQLSGEIPEEVCNLIESNNLSINDILDGNNLINTCE